MGDGGLEHPHDFPGKRGVCPNSDAKSDAVGTPPWLAEPRSQLGDWAAVIARLPEPHQRLVWALICGLAEVRNF